MIEKVLDTIWNSCGKLIKLTLKQLDKLGNEIKLSGDKFNLWLRVVITFIFFVITVFGISVEIKQHNFYKNAHETIADVNAVGISNSEYGIDSKYMELVYYQGSNSVEVICSVDSNNYKEGDRIDIWYNDDNIYDIRFGNKDKYLSLVMIVVGLIGLFVGFISLIRYCQINKIHYEKER